MVIITNYFVYFWIKLGSAFISFYVFTAGLVERVVLLGAPVPILNENWEAARKVVTCFLKPTGLFTFASTFHRWWLV